MIDKDHPSRDISLGHCFALMGLTPDSAGTGLVRFTGETIRDACIDLELTHW